MEVILNGLRLIGFQEESKTIADYWTKYLALNGSLINANYKIAFPKHLLEHCAILAIDGTKAIKTQIAKQELKNEVYKLLNTAWLKFIDDPNDYISWERRHREEYDV